MPNLFPPCCLERLFVGLSKTAFPVCEKKCMNANFLRTLLASSHITVLLLTFKLEYPLNMSLNRYSCLQVAVAQSRFQPQLIVYNAGTDILDGDPLGRLKVCSISFRLKFEPRIFSQHPCNMKMYIFAMA